MFETVNLTKEHLLSLSEEPSNKFIFDWMASGHADEMIKTGVAGILNGQVMVCGGAIEQWNGRAFVWSIFSTKCKTCFLPVYRGIKRFFDTQPYTRLEFAVPINNPYGHRRALMLGFKLETPLAEKYLPNGEDCALYALVRSN